jgi:hypothetical protein
MKKTKYKNKYYDSVTKIKNPKPVNVKGSKLTETIHHPKNKNLAYRLDTIAKNKKMTTRVNLIDLKTGKARFFASFNSGNDRLRHKNRKSLKRDVEPTISVKRGESYQILGTMSNLPQDKWKVKHTQSGSKITKGKIGRLQQIWVKAECFYRKVQERKFKGPYIIYGYSYFGGNENEAINNVYGKMRTQFRLSSGDDINVNVISKGTISYDR